MEELLLKQKEFFQTNQTKNINFRKKQLNILKNAIIENEKKILEALNQDLGKCEMESYSSEIGVSIHEINLHLKNLNKWSKSQKVGTDRFMFPLGKSYIMKEPLGNVLIIGPWNYPFGLIMSPLVGAISAGNCVTLKPSEISKNTSKIIKEIIENNFPPEYIQVVEGGANETQLLLNANFDYIFYTGGEKVGKIVMEAAAKNITPLTLELGGKSPCIIDKDCNLDICADRICFGKFINVGQTCIAPDYILVDKEIKEELIEKIKETIIKFYGTNAKESKDYGRIININHFNRLKSYLIEGNIAFQCGEFDEKELFFPPTIIDKCDDCKIMEEEIFGPILPILEYDNIEEAIDYINNKPKPLALYIFSNNKTFQNNILLKTSSGGVSINDTLFHIVNDKLPFGGVGNSGFGKYHGKASFELFSNSKSVFKNATLFNLPIYPPYKEYYLKLVKFIFGR
ncbi:MAG: aldehyde dehydrogenase [Candidatus Absconditabacteria bacterium]